MVRTNSSSRVAILLVDDHPATLVALRRLLTGYGYDVQGANTLHDALHLAQSSRIDLLISDIDLSDGTGMDLMRQLNQLHPTVGIAVSGHDPIAYSESCREAGFSAYLTKPTDLPQLLSTIEKVVAHRSN
jgi:CheY-like chemotaxis protein